MPTAKTPVRPGSARAPASKPREAETSGASNRGERGGTHQPKPVAPSAIRARPVSASRTRCACVSRLEGRSWP
jgi:hypothetical protein